METGFCTLFVHRGSLLGLMIGCKVKEVENIAWNTRKCSTSERNHEIVPRTVVQLIWNRETSQPGDLSADRSPSSARMIKTWQCVPTRPPLQLGLTFLLLVAAVKPGDTRLARSPKSEKGWAINCRPRDFLIAGYDVEVNFVISSLTCLSLQPFAESSSRSRHVLQLLTFTLQLHFSRPAREPFPPHRRRGEKEEVRQKKKLFLRDLISARCLPDFALFNECSNENNSRLMHLIWFHAQSVLRFRIFMAPKKFIAISRALTFSATGNPLNRYFRELFMTMTA